MSETNAERLERLSRIAWNVQRNGAQTTSLKIEEIEWLINQAGYAEYLGKKTVELNEFLQGYTRPKDLGRNVVDVAMEMIKEQAEQVETFEMKYENTGAMFSRQNMTGRIERLEEVNERLREALEFYAKPISWRDLDAHHDGGHKALMALEDSK